MITIDIEMPIYCYDCPCHNGENGRCNITGDSTYDKRPFDCPLKDVKLTDLPSAQSERKEGKWKGKWVRDEFGSYCSYCGFYAYRDKFERPWESNFCPNCGTDLREEKKE